MQPGETHLILRMNASSEFVPGQEPSTGHAPPEQGTIRDLLRQ